MGQGRLFPFRVDDGRASHNERKLGYLLIKKEIANQKVSNQNITSFNVINYYNNEIVKL